MMKKNYFWGVFLILAGAYLVVSQLGYLPAVGVFSLLFTVVCIAVIVASIPHVHFGGILFPLAFIAIIYDKPLGITAITPWTNWIFRQPLAVSSATSHRKIFVMRKLMPVLRGLRCILTRQESHREMQQ